MIRIWAKIINDDRIQKSFVYEKQGLFDKNFFIFYISEICNILDISTPVIVPSKHLTHYKLFKNTTFKPADFVETVNFDKFVIEDATL